MDSEAPDVAPWKRATDPSPLEISPLQLRTRIDSTSDGSLLNNKFANATGAPVYAPVYAPAYAPVGADLPSPAEAGFAKAGALP